MKIGLVVHFFDFRNDVRQWMEGLAARRELVLFLRKEDQKSIEALLPPGIEVRLIDERKSGLWNKVWELLFRFLGHLPKSRQNFFLMEQFKISIAANPEKQASAKRLLGLTMALPKWLSYDAFVDKLHFKGNTKIADIDQFVCFTELSDNYFVARLLREQKPVKVYVYSWDHPCKHRRFSKRMDYLVWHEGIRQDLTELQNIPPSRISIFGATQMGYVHRFLQQRDQKPSPFPFPYLYFGCAIGVPPLVPIELEIVRKVAERLLVRHPDWKLVVRPYPVLRDWAPYDALKSISNVVVDDGFRSAKAKTIAVGEEALLEKFVTIHHSKAFLHLGTTLGIEASYTQAPSVLLDLAEYAHPERSLDVHHFVHQYQNDKYLHLDGYPNVVQNLAQLDHLLDLLATNPAALQPYNQKVSSDIPPRSFDDLAVQFLEILEEGQRR
jgi:hypothetical protein